MALAGGGGAEIQGDTPQAQQRLDALSGKQKRMTQRSLVSTRVPSEHGTGASLSTLGARSGHKNRTLFVSLEGGDPEADELLEDVGQADTNAFAGPSAQADELLDDVGQADMQASVGPSHEDCVTTPQFLDMLGCDGEASDEEFRGGFFSFLPASRVVGLSVDLNHVPDEFGPDKLGESTEPSASKAAFAAELDDMLDEFAIPDGINVRSLSNDAFPDLGKPDSQSGRVAGDQQQSTPNGDPDQQLSPDQASAVAAGNRVPSPPLPRDKPGFQHTHRRLVKSPNMQHASPAGQPPNSSGGTSTSNAGGVAEANGSQDNGLGVDSNIAGAPGQALLRWRRRS